ncbi:MAG: hypothetical protein ACYDGR_10240 [Candidatus Dormibacteria bacterium]
MPLVFPLSRPTLRAVALAALSIGLSACGQAGSDGATVGQSPTPPVPALQAAVISSVVVTGKHQRLSLGILDRGGVPVPGVTVRTQVVTIPPAGSTEKPQPLGPVQEAPYEGGKELQGKGVYVVYVDFDHPGLFQAYVDATLGAVHTRTRASFQVIPPSQDPTPKVGQPAPRTQNPTVGQAPLNELDTGIPPDDMHYISVAAAVAAHHPFVVYFGSPGFCASKICGPVVDAVKAVEPTYRPRGVDFLHIETYKGGRPDAARTTSPFFDDWKLQTDPWVFVVNREGIITARFDGPLGADEISAALDSALA